MAERKDMPSRNANEAEPRRILAGFGPIADEMQTIEAALALAEALRAEITGHFVEESNLLDLAALPFTKTIRPTGRSVVPLELSQMEREISHAAATWRRTLNTRAERSRISCTFSTTRGEYCTEIAKAAAAADIVVINPANVAGRGRNAVAAILDAIKDAAVTVLLPDYRPALHRGPVVLLVRDEVPGPETLRLAERIASIAGSELIVLTMENGSSISDSEIRSTAREAIDADIRVHRAPGPDISDTTASVGALRPSFVVWPESNQSLSGSQAEMLLRASRAPLLLVRQNRRPD